MSSITSIESTLGAMNPGPIPVAEVRGSSQVPISEPKSPPGLYVEPGRVRTYDGGRTRAVGC
jgi:hypothetical protein